MNTARVIVLVLCCLLAAAEPARVFGQAPAPGAIDQADLREFLTYLSSDQLMGRRTFTEGYGLAASYVAARLRQWGVTPLGGGGTYFQPVSVRDVEIASDASTVTVEVKGRSTTFRNGEGVRFASPPGGPQTLTFDGAEFLGYGLYLSDRNDYAGKNVKGRPVVWMAGTPADLPQSARRLMAGRARHATSEAFAAASISYVTSEPDRGREGGAGGAAGPSGATPGPRAGAARRGRLMVNTVLGTARQGDFVTTTDFDAPAPPHITGGDEFFEALFSGAPVSFAEIKARAARREPLPGFSLRGVKLTIAVDATYEVRQTLYTHNVVGLVEGRDPRLAGTYVMFGAHLDHLGYAASPGDRVSGAARCPDADPEDVINNGANDDASGSAVELTIAKAFATGRKPRRSLVFVWHAGEELGLYGSKYNADFPIVPLDRVEAELNMDMIGRDEWDDQQRDFRNSVYVIGADRISTDLHNTIVDVNADLPAPLTLDYGMNDPADPEAVYYRSDHYSYASKGVPVAFFTTGLFSDYHCPSDTADKIQYGKMARVAQLVYRTGFALADRTTFLERDNLGPRSGAGFEGKIGK